MSDRLSVPGGGTKSGFSIALSVSASVGMRVSVNYERYSRRRGAKAPLCVVGHTPSALLCVRRHRWQAGFTRLMGITEQQAVPTQNIDPNPPGETHVAHVHPSDRRRCHARAGCPCPDHGIRPASRPSHASRPPHWLAPSRAEPHLHRLAPSSSPSPPSPPHLHRLVRLSDPELRLPEADLRG